MPVNQVIKIKRGLEANLIAKLKVGENCLGVPLAGEPVYATDTKVLKIGDGITDYEHLTPISGGSIAITSLGDLTDVVLQDPLDGQILYFNGTEWVNKDLADGDSIVYLPDNGLAIKGHNNAQHGQMPVKDNTNGIAWVTPVSDTALQQQVAQAEQHKTAAGNYATAAGSSASDASLYASQAESFKNITMNYVNQKFWWGTLSEYNALEEINPGTFYFVRAEE